jgi:hypothetical protein
MQNFQVAFPKLSSGFVSKLAVFVCYSITDGKGRMQSSFEHRNKMGKYYQTGF